MSECGGDDACSSVVVPLLPCDCFLTWPVRFGASLFTNPEPASHVVYKSTRLRCCTSCTHGVTRMQQATPRCQSFLLINRLEITVGPSDTSQGFELIAPVVADSRTDIQRKPAKEGTKRRRARRIGVESARRVASREKSVEKFWVHAQGISAV